VSESAISDRYVKFRGFLQILRKISILYEFLGFIRRIIRLSEAVGDSDQNEVGIGDTRSVWQVSWIFSNSMQNFNPIRNFQVSHDLLFACRKLCRRFRSEGSRNRRYPISMSSFMAFFKFYTKFRSYTNFLGFIRCIICLSEAVGDSDRKGVGIGDIRSVRQVSWIFSNSMQNFDPMRNFQVSHDLLFACRKLSGRKGVGIADIRSVCQVSGIFSNYTQNFDHTCIF